MSYKIRIKERNLPNGRVSLEAALAVLQVLKIAIRAESTAMGARKAGGGRRGKLARESSNMSLVRIEDGSGVLVCEPEHLSLLDASGEAFDSLVSEVLRTSDEKPNLPVRRALLALESIFREQSPVQSIEFIDDSGRTAFVDAGTVYRLRQSMTEALDDQKPSSSTITGRLMEIDIAQCTFRVDDVTGRQTTIAYDALLESLISDSLKRFVTAYTSMNDGLMELVSLEAIDDIPNSTFYDRPSLQQIMDRQNIEPIVDFDSLALRDPDPVNSEDFDDFLRSARHDP